MQLRDLVIYCATQKKRKEDTSLWKSLIELGIAEDIECVFFLENKNSLAEFYNYSITSSKHTECDGIILVHDDVCLEHDPRPNLYDLFEEFDVVGVAGCSRAEIKTPALWHIMGGGFGSGNLHGAVAHKMGDNKHMTNFGNYPHEVVMIDGVFMALSKKAIDSGVYFDEECPSKFHFYDLLYCKNAKDKGLKIGVGDVMIIHESPGLREFTEEWKVGNEYYLKQYE